MSEAANLSQPPEPARARDRVPLITESVAQRARAFEHLFDAVVVTDTSGVITDWNPGAARLYGYTRDEVLGQPVAMLHVADDAGRMTADVFAAIERQGFWTGEIQRRCPDGSAGWIESLVVPVFDAEGRPAGALGINRDITARRRDAQELRDGEERWRALLEGSPDAVVVVDQDGALQMVNRRTEALFGWSRGELLGQALEILVPEARRADHVGHRQGFVASAHSRPIDSARVLKGRRKDGSEFSIDVRLSAIDIPNGRWVLGIVHDLGERDLMSEQVRVLGAALRATVNGVAISDLHGKCQWVNPGFTAITGYAESEIVGHSFALLKSGVHDEAFYVKLWQTIRSGHAWHGDMTNRHKDGHLYVEEQTITPVRDGNGDITNFVAIKQDVTRRREMEDELRLANELLRNQLGEIQALQAQLREQAIRDPLTGLHNRRYLAESLEREVARARREKLPIAFAIIDIDHFKVVNDTHGHRAGDRVLEALGALLRSATRRGDIVCRYGGEEFTVLMPGMSRESAVQRAEEWRERFAAQITAFDDKEIRTTMSIGVALFPIHGEDGEEVLRAADAALYEAKNNGRNHVRVAGL